MPHTLTKTAYKFEELDDQAKERARDWWRTLETGDFDTDCVIEDAQNMAALLGVTFSTRPVNLMSGKVRHDPCVYWSGFSSQGDGACFEGSYSYAKGAAKAIAKETGGNETVLIDIANRLQAIQRSNFYKLEARTKHHGHYNHSGCMSVEVWDDRDHYASLNTDDEEELTQCLRDFADWIYSQLEAEYTYRMSDENVDDSIVANEYDFDKEGRRVD